MDGVGRRHALLGRDRRTTAWALGTAAALAAAGVVVVLLGAARVEPLAPLGAAVVAGTAAAHARRNDGLLAGWLVVFVPSFAWLAAFPVATGRPGPPAVVVGRAALGAVAAATLLGTPAHAAGRVGRYLRGPASRTDRLLLGRTPRSTAAWLAGGGSVAVVVAVLSAVLHALGAERRFAVAVGDAFVAVVVLALVGAVAVQAYRNQGLLVGWVLVYLPVAAAGFPGLVTDLPGDPVGRVLFLGLVVLAIAALLGSVGTVLGIGARVVLAPSREPRRLGDTPE